MPKVPMIFTSILSLIGAIVALIAFRHTSHAGRAITSHGREHLVVVQALRILTGVTVLMGFVCLGFYLDGHEEIAGGRNPWWTCLVFWLLACVQLYILFDRPTQ